MGGTGAKYLWVLLFASVHVWGVLPFNPLQPQACASSPLVLSLASLKTSYCRCLSEGIMRSYLNKNIGNTEPFSPSIFL